MAAVNWLKLYLSCTAVVGGRTIMILLVSFLGQLAGLWHELSASGVQAGGNSPLSNSYFLLTASVTAVALLKHICASAPLVDNPGMKLTACLDHIFVHARVGIVGGSFENPSSRMPTRHIHTYPQTYMHRHHLFFPTPQSCLLSLSSIFIQSKHIYILHIPT